MILNGLRFVGLKVPGKRGGEDKARATIPIPLQQNLNDIGVKDLDAHERYDALAVA
jgi:hypothetical protein